VRKEVRDRISRETMLQLVFPRAHIPESVINTSKYQNIKKTKKCFLNKIILDVIQREIEGNLSV
jgi:hypothetical protein